jgi:uncharacterized MnhB-related membrane protein
MPPSPIPASPSRWLLVALRVLLVTFLLALLAFAVCLFLGILGLVISAAVRGVHPNMTHAYRYIAFPAAVVAGAGALVAAIVLEARYYRQERDRERWM